MLKCPLKSGFQVAANCKWLLTVPFYEIKSFGVVPSSKMSIRAYNLMMNSIVKSLNIVAILTKKTKNKNKNN